MALHHFAMLFYAGIVGYFNPRIGFACMIVYALIGAAIRVIA